MPVYKSSRPTKDGRCWFFKVSMKDVFGDNKPYVSKLYKTQKEAKMEESKYMLEISKAPVVDSDITFRNLYERFLEHQDDKVRDTTKYGYKNNIVHLESMLDIKCVDYTIDMFEAWKNEMNQKELSTIYKNTVLKLWKAILNYGMTWHELNFNKVYRKMTNFNNPNELRKEMNVYTYEEFQTYLSVENKDVYRCLWKILYYCGLRCGEARGLTWKDFDYEKRRLIVNKQVQDDKLRRGSFKILPTKTKNSNRTVPVCDDLFNELSAYHEKVKKLKNYNDSFFIVGRNFGIEPFTPSTIRSRNEYNCKKAKLKQIRIHDFRHSCASLLINNGASVTMVAKYLGHTKIDMTLNTYSHMFQSALDEVIDIINGLNKDE